MALARARAVRALHTSLRHGTPRLSGPGRTQLPRQLLRAEQRRWQSGDSHGHAESGSDLPWAIGAVVVTVPATWYLWPEPHHADAGHHGGHEEHAEEGSEEKEDDAPQEEESGEKSEGKEGEDSGESESKGDEGAEEKKESKEGDGSDKKEDSKEDGESDKKEESKGTEDSGDKDDSKSGGDSKEDEESSKPAEGQSKDAPQSKGKMKGDAEGQSDSRKLEPMPPSKGGMKKRIDSGAQKDLGGGDTHDNAATAKEAAQSQGDISSKQAGISNTATRHSTQIDQDPTKSKKGEGTPETAKSMGTVDSSRPAR